MIGSFLAKPHAQFTARTKISQDDIAAELAKVREQGFATCDQELDPGVLSYACLVRVGGSAVLYSLGLVGLADRLRGSPSAKVVAALKMAAEMLSTAIRDDAGSSLLPRLAPHGGVAAVRIEAGL